MMVSRMICTVSVILLLGSLAWAGTLTENFDSGEADGWQSFVGDWKVENGAYAETGGTLYARTVFGDEEWKDYTVEVDVTLVEHVNQNCAGLLVRADAEGNLGFRLWIRTDEWKCQVSKWIGENKYEHIVEKYDAVDVQVGGTYHLKAVVEGQLYQFYLNGELVSEYEDAAKFRENGKIGFLTANAHPAFDNLVISGPEIMSTPVESKDKLASLWGSVKSGL